jgi:WD40 repeat protein
LVWHDEGPAVVPSAGSSALGHFAWLPSVRDHSVVTSNGHTIALQKFSFSGHQPKVKTKHSYATFDCEEFHSLSLCSDAESFLTAGNHRIQLWNLERAAGWTCLDIAPDQAVTEVMTAAEFHPTNCSVLAAASTSGAVRLHDIREKSRWSASDVERSTEHRGSRFDQGDTGMYAELLATIFDVKFASCGRRLFTRDLFTVQVWDISMMTEPMAVIQVPGPSQHDLPAMHADGSIFEKFYVSPSPDGFQFVTGAFGNSAHIFDSITGQALHQCTIPEGYGGGGARVPKVGCLAWHPDEPLVSCVKHDCVSIHALKYRQDHSSRRRFDDLE